MNSKKSILNSAFFIAIIVIVLSGCGTKNPEYEVRVIDNPTAILYQSSEGFAGVVQGSELKIGEKGVVIRGEHIKKEFTVLGKDYTMFSDTMYVYKGSYYQTESFQTSRTETGKYVFVEVDSSTGNIVGYTDYGAGLSKNPECFKEGVSTEQCLSDYALKIIKEYGNAGDACIVDKVTTEVFKTVPQNWYPICSYPGFVSDIPLQEDEMLVYRFDIYQLLFGLKRADSMYVRICANGRVAQFNCIQYTAAYAPFIDLQLDSEKIMSVAENAIEKGAGYPPDAKLTKFDVVLVPDGGDLWAEATAEYEFVLDGEVFHGGVKHLIKVAETVNLQEPNSESVHDVCETTLYAP